MPPAPSDQLDAREVPPTDAAPTPHAEKILLADDNPDMREYVSRLLGKRYRVAAVASGEEALKAALSDPPDLILSDVMMPGLDGFGLINALRAHPETRTIPVVLLSARAGEESRVEGLGAGADDYLIKPFTARELLARVAAHLSMRKRRKEAEEAVRESQSTLQSFYDSSPFLMGVVELDGENIVPIYCNSAVAKFYGTDTEAILTQTKAQLGIPRAIDDLWVKHYRQSQTEGRSIRFEYQHARGPVASWLSASVNFLGSGPTLRPRFSFVAEDITEGKRNEERLQRSNEELRRANADLEQFAYSASHDLQEPLWQIAIYSELLEKKHASQLDGKASMYLEYCIEGAHRMELLISGLLSYSQAAKAPNSPLQSVEIGEVLETVKQNLLATIEETGVEISAPDLPAVQGDAVPLVHLFQNLISNALKYRSQERPKVRVTASEQASHWRFAVEDNGIGIPPAFQSQIFGIFKRLHDRTAYPGTGIGLAICQKIVERHGAVSVWNPSPAAAPRFSSRSRIPPMKIEKPHLLLVEDNLADAHLVSEALAEARLDCQLSLARDGAQAIEFIDHLDSDPSLAPLDLVLLDLNLPKVSGEDVLKHLKTSSACSASKVLVMSSSDAPADKQRAMDLGATDYFRKPSNLDQFLELGSRVRQILAKHQ